MAPEETIHTTPNVCAVCSFVSVVTCCRAKMQAQLQIRQNALEVQDYMKDLFDWEKSIKDKQALPKHQKPSSATSDDSTAPAIRGRAPGLIAEAPASTQGHVRPSQPSETSDNATAAGHTYKNYSKWKNFDPDADPPDIAESVGTASNQDRHPPISKHSPSPASPHDIQHPDQRVTNRVKAQPSRPSSSSPEPSTSQGWKDRGNKLFQAGEYSSAIECYSRSIDIQPTCLSYANRAMAHLKLRNHSQAEVDCSAAINIDDMYVKAYQRRATARKEQSKLLEAAEDFDYALRLEPTTKTLQTDRDLCLQQYLQSIGVKPTSQRQKLHIKHSSHPEASAPSAAPAPAPAHPVPSVAEVSQPLVLHNEPNKMNVSSSSATISTRPGQPQPAVVKTIEDSSRTEAPQSAPRRTARKATAAGSLPQSTQAAPPTASSTAAETAAGANMPSASQRDRVTAAAAAAAQQLGARLLQSIKAPKTSTDFEAAWRSFKQDTALQVRHLFAAEVLSGQVPQLPVEAVWISSMVRSAYCHHAAPQCCLLIPRYSRVY